MITASNIKDQQLLEGILIADNGLIEKLYDMVLPSIISWVKRNNGTEADARDVFQDALIALFRRLEEGDFILTCTLRSFLRIMCRNIWLGKLRNQKKIRASLIEETDTVELDHDIEHKIEHAEKEALFFKHFDELGTSCKDLLKLYFDKIPVKKIAVIMKTSESYVKKRKFICKEKLVKAIKLDPLFNQL